jgi:hypothetical protein
VPIDLNDPSKSKWTEDEIAETHDHIRNNMRAAQEFMSYLQTLCPRACVVTGLARIDYELERILRKIIDGDTEVSDDRLFAPDRPLGTYSSRCEMCFRLGLIDASFLKALRLYGKMRNLYAHEFEHVDMMASPVRDWMQEIENIVSVNDESTPEGLAFKKQREHPFFRFAIPLGLVLTMLMRLHFETPRFKPAFVASLHIDRTC